MSLRAVSLPLTLALLSTCSFVQIANAQKPPLKLERAIALPGVEGRIDHLAVDLAGKRVFVAALGHGTVEVVDLAHDRRVGQIKGLKEPQGLYYREQTNILYVATGGDGTIRSYNGQTLAPIGEVALGDDADNVRYDTLHDQVLVGYGDGAIASLNPDLSGRSEVPLPAHPESFQISSSGSQLIVNLPHDQSIALVSMSPLKIQSKWTHLGAQSNFPMAIDRPQKRFFVACRAPAQLLELREGAPAVQDRISTVGDADDLFWDESRNRLYTIGGEGFIDVVDAPAGGRMKSIAHVPTAAGARTGLLVPSWNKLIVAAPHRGAEPARLLIFDVQ
jgi:DNA-binding beta-propeller fold protein YncE